MNLRVVAIVGILLGLLVADPDMPAQQVGERLPELHITDWILGSPEDVGKWGDGKVYILEFWGTWCAPCMPAIPKLTAIQKQYKDQGLVVIGYSWESPDVLRPFVKEKGKEMEYVVVSETDEKTVGVLADAGVLEGFPYAFLVDRAGLVAWRGHPKALGDAVDEFFGNEVSVK